MKQTDEDVGASTTAGDVDARPGSRRNRQSQGMPRWVKVIGTVVAVLIVAVIALHVTGHSPGGHLMHHGASEHEQ